MRSPSGLEVHLPSPTAGQRRKQGLAQHREGTVPAGTPSFSERYWGAHIREAPIFCLLVSWTQNGQAFQKPRTWFLQVTSTACPSLPCHLPSVVHSLLPHRGHTLPGLECARYGAGTRFMACRKVLTPTELVRGPEHSWSRMWGGDCPSGQGVKGDCPFCGAAVGLTESRCPRDRLRALLPQQAGERLATDWVPGERGAEGAEEGSRARSGNPEVGELGQGTHTHTPTARAGAPLVHLQRPRGERVTGRNGSGSSPRSPVGRQGTPPPATLPPPPSSPPNAICS